MTSWQPDLCPWALAGGIYVSPTLAGSSAGERQLKISLSSYQYATDSILASSLPPLSRGPGQKPGPRGSSGSHVAGPRHKGRCPSCRRSPHIVPGFRKVGFRRRNLQEEIAQNRAVSVNDLAHVLTWVDYVRSRPRATCSCQVMPLQCARQCDSAVLT